MQSCLQMKLSGDIMKSSVHKTLHALNNVSDQCTKSRGIIDHTHSFHQRYLYFIKGNKEIKKTHNFEAGTIH